MIHQLPLALDLQHAPALDDFIVGGNGPLLDALRQSFDSDGETLFYLFGPPGSGRTHLLLGQCGAAEKRGLRCVYLPLAERAAFDVRMLEGLEEYDLLALDDVHEIAADHAWEEALFALFNRCRDHGRRLLFTADRGPSRLPLTLADLRSRLAWGLTLSIRPLDDRGRQALLKALAERRALTLPDDVARYLLERTSRAPADLVDTIARLDRASLAERRRLTIPFVRDRLKLI